jgi:hypothetical protein
MQPFRVIHAIALYLASCVTLGCAASEATTKDAQAGAAGAASTADHPAPAVPTFWVYRDGAYRWEADYSWLAEINYHDTNGHPVDHHYDIAVKIIGKWGGFQPYAPGKRFDVRPYKYLVYSVKPTVSDQVFGTGFAAINDVGDGKPVTVSGPPYGPKPVAGQWATYKIPLSEFALDNPLIQKFTIADGTGLPTNLYYVDNIAFTAD